MLTKLEILKKMYEGLAAQGWKRAVGDKGGCEYLTPDNLRCGVGQLFEIPTNVWEYASRRMMGCYVHDLNVIGGTWSVPEAGELPDGSECGNVVDEGDIPSLTILAHLLNAHGVPATKEMRTLLSDAQSVHDVCDSVFSLQSRFIRFVNQNGYNP